MKRFAVYYCLCTMLLALLFPQQAESAVDREQEIRSAVTAFLAVRTSGMGWEVRLKKMTIVEPLKLPAGKVEYEIAAPQQWSGWGTVNISVLARLNDEVVRNIPVRIDVEAVADMVVALHQIEHGDVISAADVTVQKREINQSTNLAARTITDVLGKKARLAFRANQPVRADQIERVPLVKSGQMVSIVAENEVLKISVPGKARSAGAEGDTIRVQNLSSLKEIPARVINATTVQVAF